MERGIFAVVEHRKLMELKNSGAVDVEVLEELAQTAFESVKAVIVQERKNERAKKSLIAKFFSNAISIDREVELMFTTRQELVDHLAVVDVPSRLCPISEDLKESLLFIDRAALYAREARQVIDMFRRHNEVIVDPDRSAVIDWVLQNSGRVRNLVVKGGVNE